CVIRRALAVAQVLLSSQLVNCWELLLPVGHAPLNSDEVSVTRSFVALSACVLGWTVSAFAATITVSAGGNLQAAIDAAKPGDTIVLQAGATFTGPFKLRAKGGTTFITIQSAPSSGLPAAGVRISPAAAPLLAKITSSTGGAALRTEAGATFWRLRL